MLLIGLMLAGCAVYGGGYAYYDYPYYYYERDYGYPYYGGRHEFREYHENGEHH